MDRTEEKEYWDEFYAADRAMEDLQPPSQFAAFALLDMRENGVERVYDLGCGNGRDTVFFLRYGLRATAVDQSEVAIHRVIETCKRFPGFASHVADLTQEFGSLLNSSGAPKAIYARFYLHALSESDVQSFLQHCGAFLCTGERMYLEYRTEEDAAREKVTAAHYRNFIAPEAVVRICADHSMDIVYATGGTGYAKWKTDDAHVARQIFVKT